MRVGVYARFHSVQKSLVMAQASQRMSQSSWMRIISTIPPIPCYTTLKDMPHMFWFFFAQPIICSQHIRMDWDFIFVYFLYQLLFAY
ncbi:hypothetical protein ACN47E_001404 [Coniothyrium glycines]